MHGVQHTPSTAYPKKCIPWVLYTLSNTYSAHCVISRLTVCCSQPVSHLSADCVVLNSLHSRNYKSTNESNVSFHRTCLPIYCLQIHCLQIDCFQINRLQINHLQLNPFRVLLQSSLIMASKFISELTPSQPAGAYPNLRVHRLHLNLWAYLILDPNCITKLSRSQSPRASWYSLNLDLDVHYHIRSSLASNYIWTDGQGGYYFQGVTEVDRVTGTIYLANPGVDRHHLNSISLYHTMQMFWVTCSDDWLIESKSKMSRSLYTCCEP